MCTHIHPNSLKINNDMIDNQIYSPMLLPVEQKHIQISQMRLK